MDLTERQISVLRALRSVLDSGAGTDAKSIAAVHGSDSRGVAQTLRRLKDAGAVNRADDGTYSFTRTGAAAYRKHAA